MNRADRVAVRALVAGAVVLSSVSAYADATKEQCIDANTQAQALRRTGKFASARERLHFCLESACPALLRDDCVRRLDELDGVQPTIIFEAKDPAGTDVTAVAVTVDGQPLADSLTGAALAVDPGEHTFTFQEAGQPLITRRIVLHETEKSRRERIVIGTAPETPAVPSSATSLDLPPPEKPKFDRRIPGFVVAGVGVAGLAAGSVLGLVAIGKNSDAECHDTHVCNNPAAERSAISAANLSTIAFVAGGVLLAGGVVWVVLASRSHGASAGQLQIAPTASGANAGGLTLRGAW